MEAENRGQGWRGLGWSSERARAGRRAWSRLTPRAAAPQTCHLSRPPPHARVRGPVLCSMVLAVSFGARVRLGPAYGGLVGVNHSPPRTRTMRGMWTSAAPPPQALKGLWEAEELWVPGAFKPQNQGRPGGGVWHPNGRPLSVPSHLWPELLER